MKDEPRRRRGKAQEASERAGRRARPVLNMVRGALLLLVLMMAGAVAFVLWGVYDVSALQQHTEPVYSALNAALKQSISQRAEEIEVPPLNDPDMIERGFEIYRVSCVQCHGAPGVGRDHIGQGVTPVPANLVHTARNWNAAEIFWTTKNGIKMSGMPSWQFKYSDQDLWSVTAFIMQLPGISPTRYRAMEERVTRTRQSDQQSPGPPDPERGRRALQGHGCIACHTIPGVVGPTVQVGPPLEGMGQRRYIAGVLANNFDNMVQWIRHPTAVDPLTAMPDLGVSERDARDIAAYLYTLD